MCSMCMIKNISVDDLEGFVVMSQLCGNVYDGSLKGCG